MITYNIMEDQSRYIFCLSTDSKPTAGIETNSILYELDTGKYFYFDETWKEAKLSGLFFKTMIGENEKW